MIDYRDEETRKKIRAEKKAELEQKDQEVKQWRHKSMVQKRWEGRPSNFLNEIEQVNYYQYGRGAKDNATARIILRMFLAGEPYKAIALETGLEAKLCQIIVSKWKEKIKQNKI